MVVLIEHKLLLSKEGKYGPARNVCRYFEIPDLFQT